MAVIEEERIFFDKEVSCKKTPFDWVYLARITPSQARQVVLSIKSRCESKGGECSSDCSVKKFLAANPVKP